MVWVTCSPSLNGRGFSVHPRRHPRESPKGLPGPLDVPGRVLVAVEHQPTARTDVGAHAQALAHALPTARTVLAGVVCGDCKHSPASVCCFAFEDGAKLPPGRIANALGQVMIPHQVCDPQI